LSLCLPLQAQRTVRMIYLNASKDAPKEISILQDEAMPLDLKILTRNFSDIFELAPKSTGIHLAPKGTIKDEEGLWKRFPQVQIPTSWEKVIIFITKDEKNNLFPLRGQAVNADASNFDVGDIMFMNLSKASVLGKIGTKEVKLRAGSRQIAKRPLPGGGTLNLTLDMQIEGVDGIIKLSRRSYKWKDRSRMVIFVLPGEGKRYPKVHTTTLGDL